MKITLEIDNIKEAIAALSALNNTNQFTQSASAVKWEDTDRYRKDGSTTEYKTGTLGQVMQQSAPERITGGEALEAALPKPTPVPVHVTPPATNEDIPELDSRGLPWDGRIHSSNHKQSNDGTWHKRRGVSNDYIKQIEAELLGNTTPTSPVTPPPAAPVVEDSVVPEAPLASLPSSLVAGASGITYAEVIARVTRKLETSPESAQDVVDIIQRHTGSPDIAALEADSMSLVNPTVAARDAVANELKGPGDE